MRLWDFPGLAIRNMKSKANILVLNVMNVTDQLYCPVNL